MPVTRETIYAEIWDEPIAVVAKRYGVSSNTFVLICERLNVPRPAQGHWAPLKLGRESARPELPPLRPGDEGEWLRGDEVKRAPVPRAPVLHRPEKIFKPDRTAKHPLLAGVRDHFENGRTLMHHDEKYLKPRKRNLVDILVSKNSLTRALDVTNQLFLKLESRGHRVILAPSDDRYRRRGFNHRDEETKDPHAYQYNFGPWRGPGRPTLLFIDAVAIGLSIYEISEELEVRYVGGEKSKYVPVGSREDRGLPRRPHDWTTRQWWANGRLLDDEGLLT